MTSPREQLEKLAAERILVFDGGYGTAIQNSGWAKTIIGARLT